jgi:hypothetical protein
MSEQFDEMVFAVTPDDELSALSQLRLDELVQRHRPIDDVRLG